MCTEYNLTYSPRFVLLLDSDILEYSNVDLNNITLLVDNRTVSKPS